MAEDFDKLESCDPEDIGDVILQIEKSFGFESDRQNQIPISTFGELVTAFENHIPGRDAGGCTTQQAFYKIRLAIADTQKLDERKILPSTKLEHLFPRPYRRLLIFSFSTQLGFELSFTDISKRTANRLWLLFGISILFFFFNWKLAILQLSIFFIFTYIVYARMANTLTLATVGDLAKHEGKKHYALSRRHPGTINRTEIDQLIRKTFADDLGLEPSVLTNDAKVW